MFLSHFPPVVLKVVRGVWVLVRPLYWTGLEGNDLEALQIQLCLCCCSPCLWIRPGSTLVSLVSINYLSQQTRPVTSQELSGVILRGAD